jgi:hypothetical protein
MDQNDEIKQSREELMSITPTPTTLPSTSRRSATTISPQADTETCATCGSPRGSTLDGGMTYPYVYAIGRVEHRFPSIGVEKEFAQAVGRAETNGLTDRQVLSEALKQHRYLARRLCYVLTIGGLETYILQPRDPMDLDLLIEAIRPKPSPLDLDAVVGVRGPIAPPEMCNGLMVPIVAFDQLYSFDRDSLRKSLPRPENIPEDRFWDTADELLDRIMQITDNAGATDEDRALNYLAMRYERIYSVTTEAFGRNQSLTGIEVRPSPLSGTRKMVDVIFSYADRTSEVGEKFSVRVDVAEEFPFLVTKLSPYLER